jgi:hypothetical protein
MEWLEKLGGILTVEKRSEEGKNLDLTVFKSVENFDDNGRWFKYDNVDPVESDYTVGIDAYAVDHLGNPLPPPKVEEPSYTTGDPFIFLLTGERFTVSMTHIQEGKITGVYAAESNPHGNPYPLELIKPA